jgi:hypothetical protein
MVDSKKYDGSQWEHSLRKLTTTTEVVENPLYSDGTAITSYTISGNTVQNGTGTPDSPVMPEGCGDLEATGEHAGQYKIPISSGVVTTNIYLGSTQTVRQIKKLVLTGNENWRDAAASTGYRFSIGVNDSVQSDTTVGIKSYCSHFQIVGTGGTYLKTNSYAISADLAFICRIDSSYTLETFKQWLAAQYANGTPVTVWYVLATPETAAVNEPLMKIGDYADTLSNATAIPTTEGANSITVDTTVQPSEFTATWTGWHNANVKKWDGSQWNE